MKEVINFEMEELSRLYLKVLEEQFESSGKKWMSIQCGICSCYRVKYNVL